MRNEWSKTGSEWSKTECRTDLPSLGMNNDLVCFCTCFCTCFFFPSCVRPLPLCLFLFLCLPACVSVSLLVSLSLYVSLCLSVLSFSLRQPCSRLLMSALAVGTFSLVWQTSHMTLVVVAASLHCQLASVIVFLVQTWVGTATYQLVVQFNVA